MCSFLIAYSHTNLLQASRLSEKLNIRFAVISCVCSHTLHSHEPALGVCAMISCRDLRFSHTNLTCTCSRRTCNLIHPILTRTYSRRACSDLVPWPQILIPFSHVPALDVPAIACTLLTPSIRNLSRFRTENLEISRFYWLLRIDDLVVQIISLRCFQFFWVKLMACLVLWIFWSDPSSTRDP